jgi:acetoacetate decarboxylase
MTEDNLKTASAVPVWCPLYRLPPVEYKNVWQIVVIFRTTSEIIEELVPKPLVGNPDNLMFIQISHLFADAFGTYNELFLGVPVIAQGKPAASYSLYLLLDNDMAICGGREIWGYPKKLGRVSLEEKDGVVVGRAERGDIEIVKAAVQLSMIGTPEDMEAAGGSAVNINTKLIPSVKANVPPEVYQLTATTITNIKVHALYKGAATMEFGMSPADPLHKIPIVEVLGGTYLNADFTLPCGEVMHDYLKAK